MNMFPDNPNRILLDAILYNESIAKIQELLQSGADININKGEFLFMACSRGNIELVHLFIDSQGDLNLSKNRSFLEAVSRKHLNILPILQPYITKKEIYDIALITASQLNFLPTCEYLVSLGANVYYKDFLAFRSSISNTNIPIIDYFISLGCPLSYIFKYIAPQEPKSESDYQLEKYLLKKKLDLDLIQCKQIPNNKL